MPTECKDFAIIVPLTRGMRAVIDLQDYALISKYKWRAMKSRKAFYARAHLPDNKALSMHKLIAGAVDGQEVDHRNGDTLDNRRDNLRLATRSQNNANRLATGKSPFKGVRRKGRCVPDSAKCLWMASIQNTYLGSFATAEEAARVYDAKARELYGEFACVNFPREGERQA